MVSSKYWIDRWNIINLILKDENYEIIDLNIIEFKNNNKINAFLDLINFKINDKKHVILINSIEILSLNNEKKNILELCKLINQKKIIPLILLCDIKHTKIIFNIKKLWDEIIINKLSSIVLKKILYKICKNNNIIINNDNCFDSIIKKYDYNFDKCIDFIEIIKLINTNIDFLTIDNLWNIIIPNKTYKNLMQSWEILITKKKWFDSIINKYYNNEKTLLPLILFENIYIKYIDNIPTKKCFIKAYKNLYCGDTIGSMIFIEHNWSIQILHGFYTCALFNLYYSKLYSVIDKNDIYKQKNEIVNEKQIPSKIDIMWLKSYDSITGNDNELNTDILSFNSDNQNFDYVYDNNIKNHELDLKFWSELNKSWLKNINKKNLWNLMENVKLYDKNDLFNVIELYKNNKIKFDKNIEKILNKFNKLN